MTPFAEKAYDACLQKSKQLGRRLGRQEWLDAVQSAYDQHIKAAKSPKRNELLDALATVGGGSPNEIIPSKWSGIAKALSEIKAVNPSVTVAEIQRRSRNYRTHFQEAALTPFALANHWALCASSKGSAPTDKGPVIYR